MYVERRGREGQSVEGKARPTTHDATRSRHALITTTQVPLHTLTLEYTAVSAAHRSAV
jgi:hypothetical protein